MMERREEPKQLTSQELLEKYTLFVLLPSHVRTEKERIYLLALREEMLKRME